MLTALLLTGIAAAIAGYLFAWRRRGRELPPLHAVIEAEKAESARLRAALANEQRAAEEAARGAAETRQREQKKQADALSQAEARIAELEAELAVEREKQLELLEAHRGELEVRDRNAEALRGEAEGWRAELAASQEEAHRTGREREAEAAKLRGEIADLAEAAALSNDRQKLIQELETKLAEMAFYRDDEIAKLRGRLSDLQRG